LGLLSPLGLKTARTRSSFYADDAALFLNPIKEEMIVIQKVLHNFGEVSGLKANLNKCVAYPIQCSNLDIADVLSNFGGATGSFPCQYLGLPLGVRKPSRAELQRLIDRIASKLKPWKGKLMSRTGRLTLVNSVLTSTLTYFLTSFILTPWAIKKIDKLRRSFLWKGNEEAKGGHCLVNWKTCCAPKELGGLGIMDLSYFGRALRLRWPWLAWDEADRPWKGMQVPCDSSDLSLFKACTKITIGNGRTAKFWTDRWLHDSAPSEVAPLVFALARRKNLTVAQAVANGYWLRGISRISNEDELHQFLQLWVLIDQVQLTESADEIVWLPSTTGQYSTKSAYEMQFVGRIKEPHLARIWKAKNRGQAQVFPLAITKESKLDCR
jgi:hypothetical protein